MNASSFDQKHVHECKFINLSKKHVHKCKFICPKCSHLTKMHVHECKFIYQKACPRTHLTKIQIYLTKKNVLEGN